MQEIPRELPRPRLIGMIGDGFDDALTTTKSAAPCVEAKQDDYTKGQGQGNQCQTLVFI